MVRNWWRLGVELERLQNSGELATKGKRKCTNGDIWTLADLGVNKNQSSRCQKLAQKSAEEIDDWLDRIYDESAYRLPALSSAISGKVEKDPHVSNNSGENEWYTPPEYIEAARKAMGGIDLDPASSEVAQDTVGATEYFTIDDDGLSREWHGNVWLNPPYSRGLCAEFVQKLLAEIEEQRVKQAILLSNNSTETIWWQKAWAETPAICFPDRRIKTPLESQPTRLCKANP